MKTTNGGWLWALAIASAGCAGCGGGGGATSSAAPTESPASLPVNVPGMPDLQAWQDGRMIFMERRDAGETARIAVDTGRGGVVTEASLNGVNVINSHDTGRGVQLALYDGAYGYDSCAGCTGVWGWNPLQGGDHWNHG